MSALLFPVQNEHRHVIDISGIWRFRIDEHNIGRTECWQNGVPDTIDMAVPASYNDVFTDKRQRDHCGDVWYETDVFVPKSWHDQDVYIRFGSATHRAIVWINGEQIAQHEGGYLPFSGELKGAIQYGAENRLIVVINNELSKTTIPCGAVKTHPDGRREVTPWFDFFNYSGLHRPVKLIALPSKRIEDITVITNQKAATGVVDYVISTNTELSISASLLDDKGQIVAEATGSQGTLIVNEATLWEPGQGYLYKLVVTAQSEDISVDRYSIDVGIRTVEVKGNQFLINGKPFYFKGFGKHEDSEYRGKGYDPVVNLRDFELLEWIGANSIRTAHYPYAEEFMQMANRRGVVVIDETPAVGQFDMFSGGGGALGAGMGGSSVKPLGFFEDPDVHSIGLENHKQVVKDLIQRDKNHPCVVMWSLANEPDTSQAGSESFFEQLFSEARHHDPQNRPLTFVNFMRARYGKCKAHQFADVICLNRYYGWYVMGGLAQEYAGDAFAQELKGWATEGKPIVITEYGADAMPGIHKLPSVQWSEEYQIENLEQQHFAFDGCDAVVGEQMWNFADFQTVEGIMRVDGNKKGAFTRTRQPKMSAHHLKARWHKIPSFGYKLVEGQ
jgi:beta-glucuronidase